MKARFGRAGSGVDLVQSDKAAAPAGNIFQRRPRLATALLILGSLAIGGTLFIALDWVYSGAILRAAVPAKNCYMPDPVRHHVLRPDCAISGRWGKSSYETFTNSLGFRDECIRQVPLADARPRLLLLGDSFTQGMGVDWRESYVGRIAGHFRQYDFLNGGVTSYSPSNYLNTARMVLAAGVDFDEVIVFIDISDAQDEAALYRDVDSSGAVTMDPVLQKATGLSKLRLQVKERLILTNYVLEFFERCLIRFGYYHLTTWGGDIFDMERSAWTYRKVSDANLQTEGYGPRGLEGGIAREKAKMTLLWQELAARHIPISVVVYPWPAQVAHDTADSRQVRIWRDWCGGKCKRFVSLFEAFQAVKNRCPRTAPGCWYFTHFIFGDMHFSAEGNALVADEVIKSLEAEPPVKRLYP